MSTDPRSDIGAELYLASTSPRRGQLLGQIGVRYSRIRVAVDESAIPGESPQQQVERLSLLKARAGWESLDGNKLLPVLAADTIVVVDDQVLGKPESEKDALGMLQTLSGRSHYVFSAIAVMNGARTESCYVKTQVSFRTLSEDECQLYWNTGEPRDKAGAYGIQGYGAIFVDSIDGSYSNVVGLPLLETAKMLARFGVTLWNEINERSLQPAIK